MTPKEAALLFFKNHFTDITVKGYDGPFRDYKTNHCQLNWLIDLINNQRQIAVNELQAKLDRIEPVYLAAVEFRKRQKKLWDELIRLTADPEGQHVIIHDKGSETDEYLKGLVNELSQAKETLLNAVETAMTAEKEGK